MNNFSLFDTQHEGKAVIYRSSAGSGKTFTLTKAYLKLVLLDTSRYSQVLAITFTNDAKDEMKTRIIDELTFLANDEKSDMRKAILKDFKEEGVVNIEDVVTSRAKTVLNSLLHDYSRFNVSTIDHFFAHLIRHLAKELHLNLGYELDIDIKKALNDSIELLFDSADNKTLSWLQDFALEQLDDDKGWNIKTNISTLGKKLFHESYLDIESKLGQNKDNLNPFIKELKLTVNKFKEELVGLGKRGIEIAHKHNLEKSDFNRGMPYVNLAKIADRSPGFLKPPTKTFIEATTLDKWHSKASDKIETISQARNDGMEEVHQHVVALFEGDKYGGYLEATAILKYIHSYGVLATLSQKVQEYRSTNNLILISDSAFILNKAINQNELPFIYEKIGAKYRYILIDEFQDTSLYQWKSLLPFFKNAVDEGGQLFVVGDVKQSIYAWRGGDMKLLLHQVEKDIHVADENVRTLDTNYRSGKNIVSFNNTFFNVAPGLLASATDLDQFLADFKKAYKDVQQKSTKEFDGYVNLRFFNGDDGVKWDEKALSALVDEVNKIIDDDFSLSDILILTRKRSEAGEIANLLLSEGISAISEEALMVTSSPKVLLIINALKYLHNKKNLLAIAEFNFFYGKVFDTPVQSLTDIPECLKVNSEVSTRPIYELIEELIIRLNIPVSGDIYLQQMLDLALTQTRKGNATIASFLTWWQEEAANSNSGEMAITLPGGEDAIKIMTIHKAKGLEYPVVMLPLIDSSMAPRTNDIIWAKPLPKKYSAWGSLPLPFNKELLDTEFSEAYYDEYFKTSLEALNLLYVAFTRAVERLYVFSNGRTKSPRSSDLINQVLSSTAFEFNDNYNLQSQVFNLGVAQKKMSSKSKKTIPVIAQKTNSSALSSSLLMAQDQSKLFLSFKSEKSEKVVEGIVLHQVMSLIDKENSVDTVLNQLQLQQLVDSKMKEAISLKVKLLFKEIPILEEWFNSDYTVLNERQIVANGKISIPDRVMISDNETLIIDYKRDKQDTKHQHQIRQYGKLLAEMGYQNIKMYLIYTNDQLLVEVN